MRGLFRALRAFLKDVSSLTNRHDLTFLMGNEDRRRHRIYPPTRRAQIRRSCPSLGVEYRFK